MYHMYLSVLNGTMLIAAVQYRYGVEGAVQFYSSPSLLSEVA